MDSGTFLTAMADYFNARNAETKQYSNLLQINLHAHPVVPSLYLDVSDWGRNVVLLHNHSTWLCLRLDDPAMLEDVAGFMLHAILKAVGEVYE